MKLHSFISILFLSFALFSCSNDDEKQAGDSGNPDNTDISSAKVDNYVIQPYNDEAGFVDINYTAVGNHDKFTYIGENLIEYTNPEGGTYPNGEPRYYVQYQLDSNKRVTAIVSRHSDYSYHYSLTYNSENYLHEMTISETWLNQDGNPWEEPKIYQIEKLTWEDENLIERHSISYNGAGEISHEAKRRYEGFLPENVNTLGVKNFGFDFFGKGGIPMHFLGSGSSHAYFHEETFSGKLIPTKVIYDVLSSNVPNTTINYTIVKDAQGRIKELKTEDGPTWWQNRIYTYED
ncbi:hypothetical protein D3C87_620510 [compost metagenome]